MLRMLHLLGSKLRKGWVTRVGVRFFFHLHVLTCSQDLKRVKENDPQVNAANGDRPPKHGPVRWNRIMTKDHLAFYFVTSFAHSLCPCDALYNDLNQGEEGLWINKH